MSQQLVHVNRKARWLAAPILLAVSLGVVTSLSGTAAAVPTTVFTVNTTADSNSNCLDLDCSLREAINGANAVNPAEIRFDIPGCPPACTIALTTELPALTQTVAIDGTTQPGYSGTPLIALDGTGVAGATYGIHASGISDDVRGLLIRDFPANGIRADGQLQFTLSDSTITNSGGAGLYVAVSPLNASTVTLEVSDSRLTDNGEEGMNMPSGPPGNYADFATLRGNTISRNGTDGVSLGVTNTLIMTSNEATGNGFDGAYITDTTMLNGTITGNVFDDNNLNGVSVAVSDSLTFNDNSARLNGSDGAYLAGDATTAASVNRNTLTDNGRHAMAMSLRGTATVDGNDFSRSVADGARIEFDDGPAPSKSLSFTDNHADNNGEHGANVFTQTLTLVYAATFSGNTVSGNTMDGINSDADTVVISGNTITGNVGNGIEATSPGTAGAISGNTITANTGEAMAVTPTGLLEAHFNRIVGNGQAFTHFNPAGTFNATNNWFGCNAGPNMPDCDPFSTAVNVDTEPWLVLGLSASPDQIVAGGTSALLGDVTRNSDGDGTGSSGQIPNGTEIRFETDLGAVGSKQVTKLTAAGRAEATLSANEGTGIAHVSARLDNQTVDAIVTIDTAPSATPTLTPTPTPAATPTPTATPAPSGTAGPELIQGDVDCTGSVNSVDALKVLRYVAQLSVAQGPDCPLVGAAVASLFGDVDCSEAVNSVDALKILRFVAQLPVVQTDPCADIDEPLG